MINIQRFDKHQKLKLSTLVLKAGEYTLFA